MEQSKKTIFLTGATGTMGRAGLVELSKRLDHFNVVVLARPSQVNREKLAPYEGKIRVVWGDLTRYEDVLRGCRALLAVLEKRLPAGAARA